MIHFNVLLLVVVGFGCRCIVATVCPPDWHRYNESCYFIIKDLMDWYEANRTCAESRANLAVPNSSSEQDYILELSQDAFDQNSPAQNQSVHLWIGCNDVEVEGEWQHCPLRGKTDSYENWKDDQPSGAFDDTSDCAIMWYSSGKWHDRKCSGLNYAVCELTVSVSQTPVFFKPTGPDDRLTPRCLLHHAMKALSAGNSCRSHPRCHSFFLPKQSCSKIMDLQDNMVRSGAGN